MADRFDLINFSKSVTTTTGGTTANVNIDANTLFVDGTNNRVGIGTAAPVNPLHIRGVAGGGGESLLRLTANSTYNGMAIQSSLANSTTFSAGFIDVLNESGAAVVSMAGEISTDGATEWSFTTQSSGTRTDRRAERVRIDGAGNLRFNSGYGSVATAFGCRAWVNFNGTGTVAIRGSGNVSSITDFGVGDFGVNMSTAMPDVNYCAVVGFKNTTTLPTPTGEFDQSINVYAGTTSICYIYSGFRSDTTNFGRIDPVQVHLAIFR